MSYFDKEDSHAKLKHNVILTDAEMKKLKDITHKGSKESARTVLHAQILLLSNDYYASGKKKSNMEISELLDVSPTTVNQIRKTYATEGIEAALQRKTRLTPNQSIKITGDFEAQVPAMALSPPPAGRARWTLRLLAEYSTEKQYIVTISHTVIGGMKYNPRIPVICMDEKPQQLLGEIRDRISAEPLRIDPETELEKPGKPIRIDYEYVRNGTSCIFMFTEPLGGWRHVVAGGGGVKEKS
jgi:hypothetical protein